MDIPNAHYSAYAQDREAAPEWYRLCCTYDADKSVAPMPYDGQRIVYCDFGRLMTMES